METNKSLYNINYFTCVTDGGVLIGENPVAYYCTNIRPIIPRVGEKVFLKEFGTKYRVIDVIYFCDYDENRLIEDQNISTDITIYIEKDEN